MLTYNSIIYDKAVNYISDSELKTERVIHGILITTLGGCVTLNHKVLNVCSILNTDHN